MLNNIKDFDQLLANLLETTPDKIVGLKSEEEIDNYLDLKAFLAKEYDFEEGTVQLWKTLKTSFIYAEDTSGIVIYVKKLVL